MPPALPVRRHPASANQLYSSRQMSKKGLKNKSDGMQLKRKRKPVIMSRVEEEEKELKPADVEGNNDEHFMKKKNKKKRKLLRENLGDRESKKSKKGMKVKKKDHKIDRTQSEENDVEEPNLSTKSQGSRETLADATQVNEVYEIPSVDNDCSKGMKKWLNEYHQRRPGLEVLQKQIDDFIVAYEARKEKERKEKEARAAEGGWTVVTHHKGRKKTTDAESGIAIGSVSEAAILEKIGKKKNKETAKDFYRFQRRDAQRNEVMMLQSKFEQDKKRIQQLRAARKFRPF